MGKKKIGKRYSMREPEEFAGFKREMARSNRVYFIEYQGNSPKIRFKGNGGGWCIATFAGKKNSAGKGFHLCRLVKRWIEKRKELIDFKGIELTTIPETHLQKVNLTACKEWAEKVKGGMPMVCIDVEDCYWDTLRKLNAISEVDWLLSLRKDEWKDGRNAAIGSLGKSSVVEKWRGMKKLKREIVKGDKVLEMVRTAVVNTVHNMFTELMSELGEDFLMYFTDCVYIKPTKEAIQKTEKFFEARGYNYSISSHHLDEVNGCEVVWWHFAKHLQKRYVFGDKQRVDLHSLETNNSFLKEIA